MNEKSPKPASPDRRFLQFSLRSLLVAMAVLSLLFGMVGRWLQQVRAEQQAAMEIQKLGGRVQFRSRLDEAIGWQSSGNHKPSRWLPGDGYVHGVYLHFAHLADAPQVTDESLVHLKPLVHLRVLEISHPKISDAGLEHLAGLTQLEHLGLRRTAITGFGFDYLKGFKKLKTLDLAFTKFDDAGLQYIEGWTNLRELYLSSTDITDAGLRYLRELHSLESLILDDTSVTSAGIKQLRHALPRVQIVRQMSGASNDGKKEDADIFANMMNER